MINVKNIPSIADLSDEENYVLIKFGNKNVRERHSRGVNVILDEMPEHTKDLRLAQALEDAMRSADETGARTIVIVD
jgi:hypothetical protein